MVPVSGDLAVEVLPSLFMPSPPQREGVGLVCASPRAGACLGLSAFEHRSHETHFTAG